MILAKQENWPAGNSNINPKKLANDNLGVFAENLDTRHADFRGLPAADSVHTLAGGGVEEFSTRFHGYTELEIDDISGDIEPPSGEALAARDAFIAQLTGYETEDMESIALLTDNPTLTFGSITATTSNVWCTDDPTHVYFYGRFNTTTGGTRWIETGAAPPVGVQLNLTEFTFSAPIAAFGCYITDPTDYKSSVRILAHCDDGTVRHMRLPINPYYEPIGSFNMVFFGFIVKGFGVEKLTFILDDMLTTSGMANTDRVGFDDIMVATSAQVVASPAGYPASWDEELGFETIFGFHLDDADEFVTGQTNRFKNAGMLGYASVSDAVLYCQDSVADSVASNTYVDDVSMGGKAYALIGEVLSATFPATIGTLTNTYRFRSGLVLDLYFKRTASGDGAIVTVPGYFTLYTNGSGFLCADAYFSSATESTLTSAETLPLNTRVHIRLQIHIYVDDLFVNSTGRIGLFVDGVMVADSGTTHTYASDSTWIGPVAPTATTLTIGTGGSGIRGLVNRVYLMATIAGRFEDFTPEDGRRMEIYPPGFEPAAWPIAGGGGGGGGALTQQNWIYRMGRETPSDTEFWLSSENDGDAARWPLAIDPNERTIITGAMFDIPSYTDNTFLGAPPYPTGGYDLGIPAPADTFTLALGTSGTGNMETRSYVITFLRYNGDEGPPSLPKTISVPAGSTVTIGSLPGIPSGNNSGITGRRIYVTTGIDYRRTAQVLIAATSATDLNVLGSVLQTGGSESKPDWVPPPDTGQGIIELWASMLGMFDGKQYMTCVPSNPHAWPIKFRRPVPDKIVGSAKWGQQWLLATTGIPRVVTGTTPLAMIDTPIYSSHACVSKRSVVGVGHGVVWASSKGLCYHGQLGTKMLTEDILTKEEWRALEPESMIGAHWGKWYICFYDNGTKRGLMIDTRDPQGVIYLTQGAFAIFNDPINSELYLLDSGNVIRKWDTGTPQVATFKSKNFRLARGANPGAARIVGTTYPITFDFWSDGTQIVTDKVISNDSGFRLPAGSTPEEIQFRWRGTGPAELMLIGEEMVDL